MKQLYKNNPYLTKLNKILNYDLDSKMPGAGFIFHGLYGALGSLLAMIGTPLVLWYLYKLNRYGWITAFIILVMTPLFFGYRALTGEGYLGIVMIYFSVGFWVIYMALLRITARDWDDPVFINRPGSDRHP